MITTHSMSIWQEMTNYAKTESQSQPRSGFTISKSDRSVRSDGNKKQFLKIIINLDFKGKGYLIFPVLARLCVFASNNYHAQSKSTDVAEIVKNLSLKHKKYPIFTHFYF